MARHALRPCRWLYSCYVQPGHHIVQRVLQQRVVQKRCTTTRESRVIAPPAPGCRRHSPLPGRL